MKKIFQYILMAVAVVATASCSNEMEEALQPANNGNLQFVVSDFPAFGESGQTRTIGTADEGKADWADGDQIFVTLTSQRLGVQTAAITYNGTLWTSEVSLSYPEDETPTVSALYAPCYEVVNNALQLETDMQLGMTEYITAADCSIENDVITISFEGAEREYSRLRIASEANKPLTVTTTGFTPAGPEGATAPASYNLSADDKGNAYLYGIFDMGGTVNVNTDETVYTFAEETVHSTSYALNARVIDATNMTTDELKAAISEKIGDVSTSINIKLPTTFEDYDQIFTPIREALTADGITDGSITLTLSGLQTIPGGVFSSDNNGVRIGINTLRAVILPDATSIGQNAFNKCEYLETVSAPKCASVLNKAFYGTAKLKTIYLPSADMIYENAFSGSGVTEITLPKATELQESVFSNCASLTRVFLPKVTKLGKNVFDSCTKLTKVQLGAVKSAGSDVFNGVTTGSGFYLELSAAQKVMTKGEDNTWTATEADYKDSEDCTNKSFLGYTFYSVVLK